MKVGFKNMEVLILAMRLLHSLFLFELQKNSSFLKEQILEILSSHIKFMLRFIEPDGNIGGELFSRGTYNIFFHGLLSYSIEFDQSIMPKIIKLMSTRYLELKVNVDDDYLVQHHLWSDMKTLILLKNNYEVIFLKLLSIIKSRIGN